MGQKVNPHGMRVGVIKDWDSDRCPPREGQCLLRKAGHRDRQGRC